MKSNSDIKYEVVYKPSFWKKLRHPFKERPRYKLLETTCYRTGIEEDYVTDLHYQVDGVLTAKAGLIWDGATGGWDYKFMKASLFHDCLCYAIGKKLLSVKHQPAADKVMQSISKDNKMFFARRWWTYGMVRGFQHFSRKSQLKKNEVRI